MTKILIIVLLLAMNMWVFFWGYQQHTPKYIPPPLVTAEIPSIKLLSEEINVGITDKRTNKLQCVKVGPFDNQQDAIEANTNLEQAGHNTELETKANKRNSGFWVLIKITEDQVRPTLEKLGRAGIMDAWRLPDGPFAGMLSLGLHSERSNAESQRNILHQKGFNATVEPRVIEIPSYWIRANYSQTDAIAVQVLQQIYAKYPNLTFPAASCD
ncbi:hypothetical protein TI04_05875 [Achromatium sp. WMS2]|nr:hypothetical protein TI04_05875 [Achromatium sp. WMS2]